MEESLHSSLTVSSKTSIRRTAAKLTLLLVPILFGLQTLLQRLLKNQEAFQKSNVSSTLIKPSRHHNVTSYKISNDVRKEYAQWHLTVRNLSQMNLKQPYWEPSINWGKFPRDRSKRFPSVDKRVQYYMGKWFNKTISMHGKEFERATFVQRKTTREYGPYSATLVNLYNLNKTKLINCFQNKKELRVFSPYCRDYIDIAILHGDGSANVIHIIGDGLPFLPDELRRYPLFAKVRQNCVHETCKKNKIESIIVPLNRKRHLGVASLVPENDIAWDEKIGKAVWRGKFGKIHDSIKDTNDMKFALVSRYVNSTIVDAKFSKHTKGAPPSMIGSYMDMKEQLHYKYIISIEGNDVSSGLKWMLFSNSVVLMAKPKWESWAMESMLEEYVHYLPIERDMSNVEKVINWAEEHPEQTRLIAERSTLFIYDLLFHFKAYSDEQEIMISIMERFENNFGSIGDMKSTHPLDVNWNDHPVDRVDRFPSVEERVKYIMHEWYDDASFGISAEQIQNNISSNDFFIASGQQLSHCSMSNSSYSAEIRRLCQGSLPEFDDRVTADLQSSSFGRLHASEKGDNIRLASKSSWRTDKGGLKESKRVLINDATKILYFGDDYCKRASFPFFTMSRGSHSCTGNGVLWPLGYESIAVEFVKSGQVEEQDTNFEQKKPTSFFMTDDTLSATSKLDEILSNKYLIVRVDNGNILLAMLSKSILLMSEKLESSSWFMESHLKPYVHFVPVDFEDNLDLERKIKWCEDNAHESRKISERASLFIHDLLFHPKASADNEEVKFRVMERYAMLYGSNMNMTSA